MNPFLKKSKQLSIFLTAGYPFIDSLKGQLEVLESYQIDFIEVGIPFSDPLADGPIIQNTSQVALQNGMNLDLIFKQLAKRATKTPLVLMGYINPIISFGLESFFKICKRVNISAFIIPDMSLEIYDRFYSVYFEKHSVSPYFLITLKTPKVRLIKRCVNAQKTASFTSFLLTQPQVQVFLLVLKNYRNTM
ncbi:MAG: tryptophan synthase subunit alpha [Flavobacteriales bacterium]